MKEQICVEDKDEIYVNSMYLFLVPCNCRKFIFGYMKVSHEGVKVKHKGDEQDV